MNTRPFNFFNSTLLTILLSSISLSGEAQQAFEQIQTTDIATLNEVIEQKVTRQETPVYSIQRQPQTLLLENGYAKYSFKNPQDWPPQGAEVRPTEVKIIFTKYPKDEAFWLTNYQWLLSKRLKALFELDSAFNDQSIRYSMLLQTDCENEFEAMQLFHGIEVKYEPIEHEEEIALAASQVMQDFDSEIENKASIIELKRMMYRAKYSSDSTIFKTLSEKNWPSSALVIDWTQSVYGYGSEAMLWQSLFEKQSNIQEVVLFNDGNFKRDHKKVIGYTGGIKTIPAYEIEKVIQKMKRMKRLGNGGDSPENDIEALIEAQNITASENLILVADNRSCMRDFVLMRHIKRPVHIVLAEVREAVNPMYVNLAWRTGGSLHFGDTHIENVAQYLAENNFYIQGIKYTLSRKNILLPVSRRNNQFTYCNKYYLFPKKYRQKRSPQKRKDPKCYFTH